MKTQTGTGDSARREEILDAAAHLLGSFGARVSLQDIAEASGIQAGSLYHHFESREAILAALIERYEAELEVVAQTALDDLRRDERPLLEQVVALAEAVAACSIRNQAAVIQTHYDPPATASKAFVKLSREAASPTVRAMRALLGAGQARGDVRKGVDVGSFADRMCRSMQHVSLGQFYRTPAGRRVPEIRCEMLLQGLAAAPPLDADLDGSAAFRAAEEIVSGWGHDDASAASLLRAAARAEFSRRGYDACTMRDIAAAAGMSIGKVYRLVGSKDELLMSIMIAYAGGVIAGWSAVQASAATPLEKIDALIWLDINALNRFGREMKIQAHWRHTPPNPISRRGPFVKQLSQVRALLAEGEASGSIRGAGASLNVRANCLLELVWTPEDTVRSLGPKAALGLARDTLLRGAARRA